MPEKELQKTLNELRDELDSTDELDENARVALAQAMDDIREALARSGTPLPERDVPLSDQVREMVSDFESTHPTFAGILRRLSEGLSSLGI